MGFFKEATGGTPPKTVARVQTWAWVLIYGGLMLLVLGLATRRYDAATGTTKAGVAHATPAFVMVGSQGARGSSPRTPPHHNRLIRVPPYTVLYPITYPLENC